MREPVCLEVGGDGWCTAWAARWLGAHVSQPSEAAALEAIPTEIAAFARWLRHTGEETPIPRRIVPDVVERQVFRAALHHGGTQAFFEMDRLPITITETRRHLRRLRHSRRMLLALVEPLPPEALRWGTPGIPGRRPGKGGGGWTIGLYLRHIAGVEKWYLSNLWTGLPRLPRAPTVFDRLELTRGQVLAVIGDPRPTDLCRTTTSSGERWTLRKVLRRLLYHERYHLRSIARILLAAGVPVPAWIRESLGLPDLVRPLPVQVVGLQQPVGRS
jgi:hypothetical protein